MPTFSWPPATTTVDLGQVCSAIVAAKGWDAQPEWCKTPSGDPGYARVAGMGLTPVDQAVEGVGPDGVPRGDCLSACVATLLDLPTSGVPLFWGPDCNAQVAALNAWLARRGLVALAGSFAAGVTGIAKGASPRFATVDHCVVWQDGRVVHDPHSSRAGLAGPPTAFLSLVPAGAARGMGGTPGALDWTPPVVQVPGIPRPIQAPMPDTAMFQKIPISRGAAGTIETLRDVAVPMALQAAADPFFMDEARSIVRDCPGRDYECYSRAIFDYALGRDPAAGGVPRLVYREQPIAEDAQGSQLFNNISSPSYLLFVSGGGLCLDFSVCLAALLVSNGVGAAYRAYWLDPSKSEASHVATVAITRDGDFVMDIVPVPAVFNSEPPASLMVRHPVDVVVARP